MNALTVLTVHAWHNDPPQSLAGLHKGTRTIISELQQDRLHPLQVEMFHEADVTQS